MRQKKDNPEPEMEMEEEATETTEETSSSKKKKSSKKLDNVSKTSAELAKKLLKVPADAEDGAPGGILATRATIRITLIDDLLASNPNNLEIYMKYIVSKWNKELVSPEKINARIDCISRANIELSKDEDMKKLLEEGITVFGRNKDYDLVLSDNQLYGFFKSACQALKLVDSTTISYGLQSYKSKINSSMFVHPDLIKLCGFDREDLTYCQRPLRASNAKGESTALSCSEQLPKGTYFTCVVDCLGEDYACLLFELLNYGALHGLGQWRNSGKGRFTWELLDYETGEVLYTNANYMKYNEQDIIDHIAAIDNGRFIA